MSRLFDSLLCAQEALDRAQEALERDCNIALAKRYLGNALEQLQCMICHKEMAASERDEEHAYYKGFVHHECAERYGGRMDYIRQHGRCCE